MLKNKPLAEVKSQKEMGKSNKVRRLIFAFCLLSLTFGASCRYDMQDQPRYKAYKSSTWYKDGRSSRELPEGTIPRGFLRENVALYTGKLENSSGTAQVNEQGQQITFPNHITEMPIPVTKETLDTGEKKYKVFCSVCHGAFGNGDGMIVRRGFPKPPSYNDDRLRNAPVGHFFDVASNGWGKMSGYSSQVSVNDRWAIVAYIRALQISQNPTAKTSTGATGGATEVKTAPTPAASPAANTNTSSNVKTNTTVNSANSNGGNK